MAWRDVRHRFTQGARCLPNGAAVAVLPVGTLLRVAWAGSDMIELYEIYEHEGSCVMLRLREPGLERWEPLMLSSVGTRRDTSRCWLHAGVPS